ncbi:hypothetical protein WA171_006486 [Blastocystis sp. BT1]
MVDSFVLILWVIFLLIIILTLVKGVKVVHQGTFMIVEHFGEYSRTLKPGIHFVLPVIENTRRVHWKYMEATSNGEMEIQLINTDRIDMREHVLDFGKQKVITKDNVIIDIDALVYFRITDPKAATFNVVNLPDAVELLTQATLRNIIAKITLDDTFSSRETINEELLERIHLDAERWGVTITRVEIQNIIPPNDIKNVMEKQIKSERTRRAEVLRADGDRMRDVITSRGNVAKQVLNAEGTRASTILRAEGQAAAKLMAAEAEKKSLEMIASALEGTGVLATEYMVAQQYLQILSSLMTQGTNKVVLLPAKTVDNLEKIVSMNC